MADAEPEEAAVAPVETSPEKSVVPSQFDDFPIDADVRAALETMGYKTPTEVQSCVIGAALGGKDLVVQSMTGSGKTAAFGIPLIQALVPGAAVAGEPHGLVLVPTRELATQVADELGAISQNRGVRVYPVYGGVSINKQTAALKEGIDVVVGTPGRLLDHIRRGNLKLSGIKTIILDEADEMLSMGFWDDVTDLIAKCPDGKQAMLFSATLPYQIAKAAATYLDEPDRIDLSGDDLTVASIENSVLNVVPEMPKPRQLLYLLEVLVPGSALIFCNTRNETEMIAKYLTQLGFVSEAITGNFRQSERERVMERIKKGDLRFMVATDVASRGIDISHLSHVFNYSLPEFPEVYLHRVGRTGRAGKTGAAVSLVDGKGIGTLSVLERQYKIQFSELTLPAEGEILKLRSTRIMKELSEKASVAEVGQHTPVAQEIIDSEDGRQVVAFLLKNYFAQQAKPKRQERADSNGGSERSAPAKEEAPRRASENSDGGEEGSDGAPRRRRRRGRRKRGAGASNSAGGAEGMETMDAATALAGGTPPARTPSAQPAEVAPETPAGPPTPDANGLMRVRVNIGFDDGFKGRGAVAKRIASLAGLNDGIVSEVESKRGYAFLKATPDVADLLVERCDGAQIGKKILVVALA